MDITPTAFALYKAKFRPKSTNILAINLDGKTNVIIYLYPLTTDKKLQKWFIGRNYRNVFEKIINYVKNNEVSYFLLCRINEENTYILKGLKTSSILETILKKSFDMLTYKRITFPVLLKFKGFDKTLIPEEVKRRIVENM